MVFSETLTSEYIDYLRNNLIRIGGANNLHK